ncbi:MAG: NTP transferase domain-containing protein [Cyanomargarita calcarea GSE-NOS-MK-12-04C]|uniref:NTP transferase domain-containing protein n=1 Tax=Cyanomargarita calcarea GSE-NOS-MK-12-04C TaxID=2839659 RepID=A0A951QME9_9CYAN|nr:NTP transferase domain-containing protein [Cyanomargarita calcarea GSE-NOS-MK-12-04C]
MGTCKTSLPWYKDKTLLSYQLENWLLFDFIPVVVLGLHNSEKQRECNPGSIVVINDNANDGKTSSILSGLQHVPKDFEMLAISAVDQPRNPKIYRELVKAHKENSALITVPRYQAKIGHPLLFANKMRSHLESIREETWGLRQIIRDFYSQIEQVEFDTTSVILDINTPEIYQKELSNVINREQ